MRNINQVDKNIKNHAPLVSVVSISFNHEKYISDALEGFMRQKCNFEIEVIIADDASSDRTQEIISQYARKHPVTIKAILRGKNIGIQENLKDALKHARGRYIALCEADDYWTDPYKLQKQVDFLEDHDEYSLVFHPVRVVYEDDSETEIYPSIKDKRKFILKNLIKNNFIQTNSVVYRNQKNYQDIPTNILPMDWYLHLIHAKTGKIGFLNSVMSVYRRHESGVWWNAHKDISKIWRTQGINHLRLYIQMLHIFGHSKEYKAIIDKHLDKMLDNIINLKDAAELQTEVSKELPELRDEFIRRLYKRIQISELEKDSLNHKLKTIEQNAEVLRVEMRLMRESRIWKLRNKIARAIGKEEV